MEVVSYSFLFWKTKRVILKIWKFIKISLLRTEVLLKCVQILHLLNKTDS